VPWGNQKKRRKVREEPIASCEEVRKGQERCYQREGLTGRDVIEKEKRRNTPTANKGERDEKPKLLVKGNAGRKKEGSVLLPESAEEASHDLRNNSAHIWKKGLKPAVGQKTAKK